jgi:hypothetical protein
MGSKGSRGWTGEPESDIPTQLFPKHVQVTVSWLQVCSRGLVFPLHGEQGLQGWIGEPESDIPTQLVPKHVQVTVSWLQVCSRGLVFPLHGEQGLQGLDRGTGIRHPYAALSKACPGNGFMATRVFPWPRVPAQTQICLFNLQDAILFTYKFQVFPGIRHRSWTGIDPNFVPLKQVLHKFRYYCQQKSVCPPLFSQHENISK